MIELSCSSYSEQCSEYYNKKKRYTYTPILGENIHLKIEKKEKNSLSLYTHTQICTLNKMILKAMYLIPF